MNLLTVDGLSLQKGNATLSSSRQSAKRLKLGSEEEAGPNAALFATFRPDLSTTNRPLARTMSVGSNLIGRVQALVQDASKDKKLYVTPPRDDSMKSSIKFTSNHSGLVTW
jgi:hypothetical protein